MANPPRSRGLQRWAERPIVSDRQAADNRWLAVPDDLDLLLERIRALLDASAEGADLPRGEVEPTLTDGYARALELDAECLRLEHRIDRITRDLAAGRTVPNGKLSGLLRRLSDTEERGTELRALLVPLRQLVSYAAA
jgi:hypothetical protein